MARKKTIPQLDPGIVHPIPVGQLTPDPGQPRKVFSEDALQELADDIKANGQIQPIAVRIGDDGTLYIVDGERRWRATKLANKRYIDCLLYEVPANDDPMERAFVQVRANHFRRDLSPMEFAQFFVRLRDEFGLKVTEIVEQLKAHGIQNMNRAYVSNLMRLVELPDWAQEKIQTAVITAAHGKYLLMAKDSPAVLDDLQKELTGQEIPTTRTLQDSIISLFGDHHHNLDALSWYGGPRFDTAPCDECKTCKTITTDTQRKRFCLDKACFDQKQEEALAAEKRKDEERGGPTDLILAPDGTVDLAPLAWHDYRVLDRADFDTAECKGCEHNHPAADSEVEDAKPEPCCFNVPCYKRKQDAVEEAETQQRKAAKEYSDWLRNHLADEILPIVPGTQRDLVAYAALMFPEGAEDDGHGGQYVTTDSWRAEEPMSEAALSTGLVDFAAVLEQGADDAVAAIAKAVVKSLDDADLLTLVDHLGVEITPPDELREAHEAFRASVSQETQDEEEDDDQMDWVGEQTEEEEA